MKNTTTTLALPTVVQPKPTKAEIIEAMVQRARARQIAVNEEASKKRDALKPKIEKAVLKLIKGMKPHVAIYAKSREPHCEARYGVIKSPELDELLAQYASFDNAIECFDEKEVRTAIRRELNGEHKPDPSRLLANPETVKAIDTTLDAMGI
jgi:hypothetical protein